MDEENPVDQLFRQGRFAEAGRISAGRLDPALGLEIDYFLGNSDQVISIGRRLLQSTRLDKVTRARVHRVLGSQLRDNGDFEQALAMFRAALEELQGADAPSELTHASCCLLECESDAVAFDASRTTALQTRRAALRSGDPSTLALTHHTFGRLEARVGHIDRALRHFAMARARLEETPNLYLRSAIDLDESSTRSFLGQLPEALDLAVSSSTAAVASGWSKGIVAAAANCAFFAAALGRVADAEHYLAVAENQRFSSPSYDLAILETRAQLAFLQGDFQRAESLLQARRRLDAAGPWYSLAAAETEIRVLTRQQKWREAEERTKEALAFASRNGVRPFVLTLTLRRGLIVAATGSSPKASDLPLDVELADWTLSSLGLLWLVRATAASPSALASTYARRALHIFQAVGEISAQAEAQRLIDEIRSPPPPTLDGAVALVDVAGHPLILAREAFALLEGSRSVDHAALVARGTKGVRVLDTFGWDERDALHAARRAADLDSIPCGSHRDEALVIVARPHDDLERRCAWLAIRKLVATALTLDAYRRDEKQRAALWPTESLDGDPDIIWVSEQVNEIVRIARRIGPTPLSVLLTGETGTGKEMLARTIHLASDRAARTMLPFNCTAVPRDMLESQLFGYRKGAFTGADTSFTGVIRAAEGGTLFLDEIADVPLDVQPKLLRFLETHEIHPLGESHPARVDVRIIAATNANLEQLVAEGRFRQDLFYRLNVVRLRLPPLRERREEIPALVEHYIRRYGEQPKKGRLTLTDEALEYLLLYPWPGNLRQLANEVQRMVALAEPGTAFTAAHLSAEIRATRRTIPASASPDTELRINLDQPLPEAVDQLERTMVQAALDRSKGRLEDAAKILGISRKGLFLKRRRWGLQA